MSKKNLEIKLGTKESTKLLSQIDKMDPVYRNAKDGDFDVENAFQIFAQLTGDYEKTAHALGVKPQVVVEMAQELNWHERLKAIFELKKSTKPGDVEKAISRALNFVMAHRYRIILERIVNKLYLMTPEELIEEITAVSFDKEGNEIKRVLSTRALSDLAAAIEKIQQLTYLALVDTVTERARRQDSGDSEVSMGSIHQIISAAMNDTGASSRKEEFAAKLAKAQEEQRAKRAPGHIPTPGETTGT
jgi:hypothetical protein